MSLDKFYVPREIIQVNAIECRYCGKVLRSYYTHNFRTHECSKKEGVWLMVDGGLDYLRHGWSGTRDDFIDRSVVLDPKIYASLPGPQLYAPCCGGDDCSECPR